MNRSPHHPLPPTQRRHQHLTTTAEISRLCCRNCLRDSSANHCILMFHADVYLCTFVYGHKRVCIRMCVNVCGDSRHLQMSFLEMLSSSFEMRSLIGLKLTDKIRLGRLASRPQGSSYLCLLSAGIISRCHCDQHFFMCVLETDLTSHDSKANTLPTELSPSPEQCIYFKCLDFFFFLCSLTIKTRWNCYHVGTWYLL